MAKSTSAKIAELQAKLEAMDSGEEAPAKREPEPVLIPSSPLESFSFTCEECGVQGGDFKSYMRFDGRLCGVPCAEDVLLAAREKLTEAAQASLAVQLLAAHPTWALLPKGAKEQLARWANSLDIPETLKENPEKDLQRRTALAKIVEHRARVDAQRKKRR